MNSGTIMKIGMIVTLGTRDVRLSENAPAEIERNRDDHELPLNPRQAGEVLEKLKADRLRPCISLPIIGPFLESVRADLDGAEVERLVLIVTDQPDTVADRFRARDTAAMGRTVKKLLGALPAKERLVPENRIFVCSIRDNVTDLDACYRLFRGQLTENKKLLKGFGQSDRCYLQTAGGIDAINSALVSYCLLFFKENLRHYTLTEGNRCSRRMEYPRYALYDMAGAEVGRLVEQFRFHSVEMLTRAYSPAVADMAAYWAARLRLDCDRAQNIARRLSQADPAHHGLVEEAQAVRDDEQRKTLEVLTAAYVKYVQKEYVDMLLRLFRFLEGYTGLLVQEKCGVRLERKEQTAQDLKAFAEKYPEKKNKLDKSINLDEPGSYLYLVLLERWELLESRELGLLQTCRNLADLRNKSIGAHGYVPVSREKLEAKIAENGHRDGIDAFFGELLAIYSHPERPFQEAGAAIIKVLTHDISVDRA